jgi:hypothetical protein
MRVDKARVQGAGPLNMPLRAYRDGAEMGEVREPVLNAPWRAIEQRGGKGACGLVSIVGGPKSTGRMLGGLRQIVKWTLCSIP